ncbi:DUF1906 domain-containing protein [Sporolactobacillus sp. THM7-7]|nr:DUF1906 domain-containing protein [Sporolactobacillus sp. THM7-7]
MNAIISENKLTDNSVKKLKTANVGAVGRYLGDPSVWKAIDAKEADLIQSAGLNLFSLWECGRVKRGYFNRKNGRYDAEDASRYARESGQPAGTPIFFMVGHDPLPNEFAVIRRYFQAVKTSLSHYRVGVCGSRRVIECLAASGHAEYFYQITDCLPGEQSEHAHIYQHRYPDPLDGFPFYFSKIIKPGPLWIADSSQNTKLSEKSQTYVVQPGDTLFRISEKLGVDYRMIKRINRLPSNDVYPGQKIQLNKRKRTFPSPQRAPKYLIKLGSRGENVRFIQHALYLKADGYYGIKTEAAVKAYQQSHRLHPNGEVDRLTWQMLF